MTTHWPYRMLLATLALLRPATAVLADPAPPPAPAVAIAVDRLARYDAAQRVPTRQKLVFVYFTPSDRTPPPDRRERLTRVMLDVQRFYADEMARNGLGRRTIQFDLGPDHLIDLHDVRGAQPTDAYRDDHQQAAGGMISRESQPVLAAAGIDDRAQTVIYFCDLRTFENGRMTGIGPYYGTGAFTGPFHSGRCWFTDALIFDPEKLADKTDKFDDQQYGHISVGKYNSIFIGGAAHEIGHALGLPHDKESAWQPGLGRSLMGSGNRTYRDDLRGEDRGSFLSLADALRLASHPMFSGSDRGLRDRARAKLQDLHAEVKDGGIVLTGRVDAAVQPYAAVVYNDAMVPANFSHGQFQDYGSTTWIGDLDEHDRFSIRIAQFRPGKARLRLIVCHVNAASTEFPFNFTVADDGTPDVSTIVQP
jgi:hypothetical protein